MSEVKSSESVYVLALFSKAGRLTTDSQKVLNERYLIQAFFVPDLGTNKE
ncbi:hypothetical protein ALQ08_02584 [Pseudomonas syringae pv. delphinii]|uniref:Uncharacterized protein n=1 Tax=Pseudomonas syringae pv. delphinii TaxID=192088 RepID=A0A0P9QFK2_9PSED|nr:hypothetical protein [Pseudomonas syringae group genomosp. 3]KPX23267.1 Unknown protein sequence [Pseudomonas syringae pv. delphinii]RMP10592.1 hypothetical protein ALQ28_02203 [Pseudomonas syringae pv. delphinii]RMQ30109.1 hypothetical protein ALQ08_02584 [Pseudomonas syringae pv. delphinii]